MKTYEELALEGRSFKYRDFNVDIINTHLFTGTAYVMLGRSNDDTELYWFFDKKTGHRVDVNGIRILIEGVLTVVKEEKEEKEEKEGWFALIYISKNVTPAMLGVFSSEEETRKAVLDMYSQPRYEIHKIIYEINVNI